MSMITAYYRPEVLPQAIRTLNGIRSANRYDCTAAYNPTEHGLLPIFQRKNGMLSFYLIPAKDLVKADSKRRATYALGDGKQNLSSLYFDRPEFDQLFYGHCNGKDQLKDGSLNPAKPFRHDALLMLCDWQQDVIEVLVIRNGKPMIENHYNLLIDGEFDEDITRFRQAATPYYPYKML